MPMPCAKAMAAAATSISSTVGWRCGIHVTEARGGDNDKRRKKKKQKLPEPDYKNQAVLVKSADLHSPMRGHWWWWLSLHLNALLDIGLKIPSP